MSMYNKFSTDKNLEQKGVTIDYGDFRVTIARAGGSNLKYAKCAEASTKPYRRAIATGTMENSVAEKVLYDIYAKSIVLLWEVKEADKWKKGIEGPDGKLLPFNHDNLVMTFEALPDLFMDIKEQSEQQDIFRAQHLEEEAKN